MGSTTEVVVVEKSAEELQREIEELHRQQRQITERLRDPRGLRRLGLSATANAGRPKRAFVRPTDRNNSEDQPPPKRRLSSAVVKVEAGNVVEDENASKEKDSTAEGNGTPDPSDRKPSLLHRSGWSRRDGNQRGLKKDADAILPEPVPRVLPKDEDPSLVNRNRRMLGQLLGTLEKFRKEDMQLSGTEAYMRRSTSLQKAEEKAREESERLRQQEREEIAEKRRRDLTLRARVAAKAEEKKLELLFLRWSEHQKKLSNFTRTKAEPQIYYMPAKPLEEDTTLSEQQKEQAFLEWKAARREELTQYQKQIEEQYLANVENELERWQNARKARKGNNEMMNLQETMDKELDTHRMEHGPKKRNIPGGNDNEDEDDVEDINAGEDDMMMDDVLGVDDGNRRTEDASSKVEAVDTTQPRNEEQQQ